ncbi:MAG TPA: hypothetical protein VNY27_03200 [Solirubrobacteraceae bacterium]|jgi:hypothetical protein|nr:hypothetical protein [Solirubrobacteraceae bacterium]
MGDARPTQDELHAALDLSWEEALISLGAFGADVGPRDALEKGARVYRAISEKLRDQVCESERVRQLVLEEADRLTLAGAIADVIASANHQLPVATVAALMTKSGLSQYCASHWA